MCWKRTIIALIIALTAILSPSIASAQEDHVVGLENGSEWQVIEGNYLSGYEPETSDVIINRIYKGVLGREPDVGGLVYWIDLVDSGTIDYADMAAEFVNSEEYRITTGNPETFIDALYANVLDRQPDAAGKQYWLNQWASKGNTLYGAGEIAMYFANSEEHKAKLSAERYRYTAVTKISDRDETVLSDDATADQIIEAIFPVDQWENAKAIAWCESRKEDNVTNVNTNGTVDYGLFQINTYYHKNDMTSAVSIMSPRAQQVVASQGWPNALYDSEVNTYVAYHITQVETWRDSVSGWRGQRWGSWTCAKPSLTGVYWSF